MVVTSIISAVTAVAAAIGASAIGATTAFTIGTLAVTWGAVAGATMLFGGVALSIMTKKNGAVYSSPTYDGVKQTQTNQDLPVPLLYGTCKLAGNRIWQDEEATKTVKRIVAFAEGEITGFDDIKLNDIPISEISGIKPHCIAALSFPFPSRNSLHMFSVSAGRTLESTEITPDAPSAIIGTV